MVETLHDIYDANGEQSNSMMITDVPGQRTFISKEQHSAVTPEQLSKWWNIGLAQSKQTHWVTTQCSVQSAILLLSRWHHTNWKYHQQKLRGQWFYMDTLIGKYTSVTNNSYAQVFANESFFAKAYPMERKSLAGTALHQFIHDFGVPEQLTFDGSVEQVKPKMDFMKHIWDYGIDYHITEPHRPQWNWAETVIQEIKKQWFWQITKCKVLKQLWDYDIVWACEIMSITSNSSFSLDGCTPMEQVTGETPDISEYVDFGVYDWVWYKDNAGLGVFHVPDDGSVWHTMSVTLCLIAYWQRQAVWLLAPQYSMLQIWSWTQTRSSNDVNNMTSVWLKFLMIPTTSFLMVMTLCYRIGMITKLKLTMISMMNFRMLFQMTACLNKMRVSPLMCLMIHISKWRLFCPEAEEILRMFSLPKWPSDCMIKTDALLGWPMITLYWTLGNTKLSFLIVTGSPYLLTS